MDQSAQKDHSTRKRKRAGRKRESNKKKELHENPATLSCCRQTNKVNQYCCKRILFVEMNGSNNDCESKRGRLYWSAAYL